MLLHAVSLLCALAAAVFATSVRDGRGALAAAAGFLAGVAWLQSAPGWTGVAVGGVAGLSLARPLGAPASSAVSLAAGLAGGLWSRMLVGYGLPPWAAWLLALGVIAVAAACSGREPRFAPPAVREDALAVLGVLGLAVAAAPGMGAGWRAAQAMNLEADDMIQAGVHPGVLLGLAAVVALGGLHALRRRG